MGNFTRCVCVSVFVVFFLHCTYDICSCLLHSNRLWTLSDPTESYADGNNRSNLGACIQNRTEKKNKLVEKAHESVYSVSVWEWKSNRKHWFASKRCDCLHFVCNWYVALHLQYSAQWSVKWIEQFLSQRKIITINSIIIQLHVFGGGRGSMYKQRPKSASMKTKDGTENNTSRSQMHYFVCCTMYIVGCALRIGH